jgi:hypothetical protein
MRRDGQTDMTKVIVAFRNFANESKNVSQLKKTRGFEQVYGLGQAHGAATLSRR